MDRRVYCAIPYVPDLGAYMRGVVERIASRNEYFSINHFRFRETIPIERRDPWWKLDLELTQETFTVWGSVIGLSREPFFAITWEREESTLEIEYNSYMLDEHVIARAKDDAYRSVCCYQSQILLKKSI